MITRHACGEHMPRHRHAEGYVAVVLTGGYVEAGDSGRWLARPGTVVVHGAYEAHRDAFDAGATAVLNLPIPQGVRQSTYPGEGRGPVTERSRLGPGLRRGTSGVKGIDLQPGAGFIDDIDLIARTAERDPREAAALVAEQYRPGAHRLADWPDLLAETLDGDQTIALADWADAMGLNPASVSRGFHRAYGVSPKRYRFEARARQALNAVARSHQPFAQVAAAHGFADQAHMTRALTALVGAPPSAIRAKSVQAEGRGPC